MFLGEMLMGMDLEGDEPGEVSKCILAVWIAYGVGRSMYMLYTQFSGFVGRKRINRIVVFASD